MIKDLERITTKSVLVDASLCMASLFHNSIAAGVAEECSEFLKHCASRGQLLHVTPEAVVHLWKVVAAANHTISERRVAVSILPSPFRSTAERMKAFLKGPVNVMRITPSIIESAIELWEKKEGAAGIEACVALCAYQSIIPSPYVIATANNDYDVFADFDLIVLKPAAILRGIPKIKARSIRDDDLLVSE